MAKIDRSKKKLIRGVKLTVDHTYDVLNEIGEGLEREIVADQMKHDHSYFRLNYQLPIAAPWTPSGLTMDTRVDNWAYQFGFALPPTQDYFNNQAQLSADTPVPILDEISFGFDQRDENCLLDGPPYALSDAASPSDGKMNFHSEKDSSSIEFVIFSKAQQIWDSGTKDYSNDEILRLELPASAYMSSIAKLNPFAVGDLNKAFNPYKTYLLAVKLNNFWEDYVVDGAAAQRFEVASLTISLKFKMKLLEPDIATAALTLPNYPKAQLDDGVGGLDNFPGNRDDFSWVSSTPDVNAAEKAITAQANNEALGESATVPGIGTTISDIDREFTKKLSGGWSEYGLCATDQQVKAEAAYEVISVPLFCTGIPACSGSAGGEATVVPGDPYYIPTQLRYSKGGKDAGGNSENTEFDRRIIPIKNPLMAHEVLLWYGGTIDSGVGINVGVGIATGLKGDQHDYQQVALMSTNGSDIDDFTIDTWSVQPNKPQSATSGYLFIDHYKAKWSTGKLIKIPIVWGNTAPTRNTTYPVQNDFGGRPFYIGKGTNITAARTNVGVDGGDETPGAPNTDGIEQWIEVRMTLDPLTTLLSDQEMLIPPQGYWVHLICKKTLC